jgi:hypothetical protein
MEVVMEPGDWVEGEPKWWWKYVYPARDRFWAELIASNFEPNPQPWVQTLTADVLEGLAMVRASGTAKDKNVSTRLKEEGFKKITEATHVAERAKAA